MCLSRTLCSHLSRSRVRAKVRYVQWAYMYMVYIRYTGTPLFWQSSRPDKCTSPPDAAKLTLFDEKLMLCLGWEWNICLLSIVYSGQKFKTHKGLLRRRRGLRSSSSPRNPWKYLTNSLSFEFISLVYCDYTLLFNINFFLNQVLSN